MRDRVYDLRYESEFNTIYWDKLGIKRKNQDILIKIGLSIGSIAGLIALFAEPNYAGFCAGISGACALIATAALPAFGWETRIRNIHQIKCRWIDLHFYSERLWERVDFEDGVTERELLDLLEIKREIMKLDKDGDTDEDIREKAQKELDLHFPR